MGLEDQLRYIKNRALRLRRARRLGTHTELEWENLKKEFGGRCVQCWMVRKMTLDHIVPIYQGGSDGIENIQPLCKRCNFRKGPENINWKEIRRADARMDYKMRRLTDSEIEELANMEKVRSSSVKKFLSSFKFEIGMANNLMKARLLRRRYRRMPKRFRWNRETVRAIDEGVGIAYGSNV